MDYINSHPFGFVNIVLNVFTFGSVLWIGRKIRYSDAEKSRITELEVQARNETQKQDRSETTEAVT